MTSQGNRAALGPPRGDLLPRSGAGYAAALEIVLHVALNTLTNYINLVADTDIDLPRVEALEAA